MNQVIGNSRISGNRTISRVHPSVRAVTDAGLLALRFQCPQRKDVRHRGMTVAILCCVACGSLSAPPRAFAEIVEMNYKGVYIGDTSIPGEQKRDEVAPSHPFCLRMSRDRWMIIFATRGFTGNDDDRSILYQIRASAPDGRVIREGRFRQAAVASDQPETYKCSCTHCMAYTNGSWDRLGAGESVYTMYGTPVAFGVPKGAVSAGRPLPNQNVFVATWYTHDKLEQEFRGSKRRIICFEMASATLRMEWVQFRLNEAEDDIELLTPISYLRQKGYETGEAFSSLGPEARTMNHWVTPVRLDPRGTEWVECAAIGGRLAIIAYTFNARTGLYEWNRTGAPFQFPARRLSEASIVPLGAEWLLAARTGVQPGSTAWFRTADLFADPGEPVYAAPHNISPRTAYHCPDGVVRLFCGERAGSPYRTYRNPLYVWDVNPDDYSISNRRVVLDTIEAGLGIEKPMVGFAKLFPPQGRRQLLTFRVMAPAGSPWPYREDGRIPLTEGELARMGSHYSEIIYDVDIPEEWEFAKE